MGGELSPGEDMTGTLKARASCFLEFHILRVYEPIDQMHFFSKLGDIFIMTSGWWAMDVMTDDLGVGDSPFHFHVAGDLG